MSITEIDTAFRKATEGKFTLISVTMSYVDGGARENFAFRVSRPDGGETKTVDVEVSSMTTNDEIIQQAKVAAEKAFG